MISVMSNAKFNMCFWSELPIPRDEATTALESTYAPCGLR